MKITSKRLASFITKNAPYPAPDWAYRAIEAAWQNYYVTKYVCLRGI